MREVDLVDVDALGDRIVPRSLGEDAAVIDAHGPPALVVLELRKIGHEHVDEHFAAGREPSGDTFEAADLLLLREEREERVTPAEDEIELAVYVDGSHVAEDGAHLVAARFGGEALQHLW